MFVEDDGWEPMRDEDEEAEEDARLEWDHNADPVSIGHLKPKKTWVASLT